MERIKRHLRSAAGYLAVCAKWLVLAALVGCVVGPLGGAFGLALNWANATRGAHPWLLYLLPAAGLVIIFLYHRFDPDGGGSTNQIFVSVREQKPLTLRTAPLIFVSTVATHLFGGSSGREGRGSAAGRQRIRTARQGAALRKPRLPLNDDVRHGGRVLGHLRHAAGRNDLHAGGRRCRLHAVRGTAPLSGVGAAGRFHQRQNGAGAEAFVLQAEAAPTPDNLVRVIILGALLAALSIFFCELLHVTPKLYQKFFPNIYLRVAAGGVLIIALTKLLGTTDYNGAGAAVIEAAIDGEAVPYAFLLKMLFTALTLGAGFKGGEIVPIFFTGATFGCVARAAAGSAAAAGRGAGHGCAVLWLHQQPAGVHLPCHRGIRRAVRLAVCAGMRGFLHAVELFQPLPRAALPAFQAAHRRRAAGTRPLVRDGRCTPDHKRRRRKLEN